MKKTMGHRTLKGEVWNRPLFLGCSRIGSRLSNHTLKSVISYP